MNALLAALYALHLFAAPAPAKCDSLFFGELPENGAILDETAVGLIVLVSNDDSIGIMRWMSLEDNAILTKMPLPDEREQIKMYLLYDDGSELLVSVIACNGTLFYSAFRMWHTELDRVPKYAA